MAPAVADRPAPLWGRIEPAAPVKADSEPIVPSMEIAPLTDAASPATVATMSATESPAVAPTRRSRRGVQTTTTPERDAGAEATSTLAPVREPALDTETFELLEPVVGDAPELVFDEVSEPVPVVEPEAAAPTAAEIDAFEAAARLFSFTGETAIQPAAQSDEPEAPTAADHVAARRNRGASFKRVTAASFSVGVMGIVGLLTVGLTTPADAVAAPRSADISTSVAASAGGDVAPADG